METKITNTTPNAEVKAPANTAATATSAAEKIAKTTPPVSATTPTTAATTAPVSTTGTPTTTAPATSPASTNTLMTASTTPPATDSAAATLPANYLTSGYYQGEGKRRYTDPLLVEQAEEIAEKLSESGTPATAINRMVRTLKAATRLPYPAQQGALKKLTPQVLDLENKKKAPPLLREVVERNQRAVQNEADFAACLDHFKDISIFLASEQD